MDTKILRVNPLSIDENIINEAAEMLRCGKTVIFPTETVYGLGANAFSAPSVQKIFEAKGRPGDNPLIVHIGKREQVDEIAAEIPPEAKLLMDEFWGGPLTIILKKKSIIPDVVSAGRDTVGIRLPSHPVANALLSSGLFVAAPSANISGKPSPTEFSHCYHDMFGKVDAIIDGGTAAFGVESTVIDLSGEIPMILRPGAVTLEMIREILPNTVYGGGETADVPKSPGMKYRHYAPKAPLFIDDYTDEDLKALASEGNVGIMAYHGIGKGVGKFTVDMGESIESYGARLFYALRKFDEWGVEKIYALKPEEDGFGAAVCNRLYKAAGGSQA